VELITPYPTIKTCSQVSQMQCNVEQPQAFPHQCASAGYMYCSCRYLPIHIGHKGMDYWHWSKES